MKANKLTHGVMAKAARHFKVSHNTIRKRLYVSFEPKTIDYVLKLDKQIKEKKENARNQIKNIKSE